MSSRPLTLPFGSRAARHYERRSRAVETDAFELVTLPCGVRSLRSLTNGQVFHPVIGPAAEADAVHLAGTRLVSRAWEARSGSFVLWDVGLGAAANALRAVDALLFEARKRENPPQVRIVSFDRTLGPLRFAISRANELGYPAGRQSWLEELRARGRVSIPLRDETPSPCIDWTVRVGEFVELLSSTEPLPAPGAIFLDPYSPPVNPEMWTLPLFESVHRRLDSSCLLTTYTRSTAVRVTLLLSGLYVGAGHATGEKDETTVAANRLDLIEEPLDRRWLQRVDSSTNAAPLRKAIYTRGPISAEDFERLLGHPQFRVP